MGLDLEPLGRAREGAEAEWSALMERLYAGESLPDTDVERLLEIAIPPYTELNAPRVGTDKAADDWVLERARAAGDQRPAAELLAALDGYYVVALLTGKVDGVPVYSNAPLGYVEATTFRGEFLRDCTSILDQATVDMAWRSVISPEEATVYGRLLLRSLDRPADQPSAGADTADQRPTQAGSVVSLQEQRQIIDAAGRWYVFWGERGNPVWANY